MRQSLIFLILLGFTGFANAELRVFQLQITDEQTGSSRTVTSNLDDIQYPGYYHVKPTERVQILDTWMCYQRSDFSQDPDQKYCEKPRRPASLAPANASAKTSANSAGGPSTSSSPASPAPAAKTP